MNSIFVNPGPRRSSLAALAGLALLLSGGCSSGGGGPGPTTPPPDLSSNAELLDLSASVAPIAFDPDVAVYNMAVGFLSTQSLVTATTAHAAATVTVSGKPAVSGEDMAVQLATNTNSIDVVVIAEDGVSVRTYTLVIFRETVANFAQDAYVKSSNTEPADFFGVSLAVDGDTLAVGALGEDSNATGVGGNQADNSATGSGAVYVFERTANVWSLQAYIKASNTGDLDHFGEHLALDGDTLVVGAVGEDSNAAGINGDETDNSASSSGAVYVFTRQAGVWSQEAYIKASNPEVDDVFGFSVALDGDTLAVGSHLEDSMASGIDGDEFDNSASGSGAVYLFTRSLGVWSQQAYIKASNTGANDNFGQSVALDGDFLAVGALGEASNATGVDGDQSDNSTADSGAVYVFRRNAGMWGQEAYIKASNTGANDQFGSALALHRDTLAVGAQSEDGLSIGIGGNEADNSASDSGAVYVLERSAGTWSQTAYMKASNTGVGDGFGTALALDGDTLVVGAGGEASNAAGIGGAQFNDSIPNSGAAYVLTRSAGVWTHQAYVKASNTGGNDFFGQSVAVDGDTLAVGARLEDSSASGIGGPQFNDAFVNSGAVYVFR